MPLVVAGIAVLSGCGRVGFGDTPYCVPDLLNTELAIPALRSPAVGAATGSPWFGADGSRSALRPIFRWQTVAGASGYELQVDDSCATPGFAGCDFATPEVSVCVRAGEYQPELELPVSRTVPVGSRYYWRLRVCAGDSSCSPWGPVRYVDVGRQRADFNGDGYADVAVGAPLEDDAASDQGAVYVYSGGPDGVVEPPLRLTEVAPLALSEFGRAVAALGDSDGDGFADLAVGAPGEGGGRVIVRYGGEAGLGARETIVTDTAAGDPVGFGTTVAGAGDVDGDGFADLAVGAPDRQIVSALEGVLFLYPGASIGIVQVPMATVSHPDAEGAGHFTSSITAGGDADGDGFADLLVGAEWTDDGQNDEGTAFWFRGTADGLNSAPVRIDNPDDQANGNLGERAALAGDINGDGLADFVVGASYQDAPEANSGSVFLFVGDTGGIADIPTQRLDSPMVQSNGRFGNGVGRVGDIDGDGYDDVLIGASHLGNPESDEGSVFAYRGGEGGLASTPFRILDNPEDQHGAQFGRALSGGDVNGDGFADVIVGAPFDTDGPRVYLFPGGPDGLPEMPTQILIRPGAQIDNSFGASISAR